MYTLIVSGALRGKLGKDRITKTRMMNSPLIDLLDSGKVILEKSTEQYSSNDADGYYLVSLSEDISPSEEAQIVKKILASDGVEGFYKKPPDELP